MTYADQCYLFTAQKILASPYSDKNLEVRPKWLDGTPAHTRKIFYDAHVYDLRKEFPMMTLRRTYWKSALQEILWIYQKKSNVIAELGSHIWDEWDVGDGTIGKGYGYQIGLKAKHHKDGTVPSMIELAHTIQENGGAWRVVNGKPVIEYPSWEIRNVDGEDWVYLDQMDAVLYDLKHNFTSRSIMTTTYNPQDLADMGLRPCAFGMYYNVTVDENTGKKYLNAVLQQRSQDMLTASNWNTVQYAFLLMLVARECNLTPGVLVHCRFDTHVYDRHEPIVRDMIEKAETEPNDYEAPLVYIPPDAPSFYEFTPNDMVVENYKYDEFNEKIEVAV